MRLLIKFPSRSRPSRFFEAIENIHTLIGCDYVISATLDLDDATMNNPEVKDRLRQYENIIVYWGLSKNKIDACNRSMPTGPDWTHLMLMSDDMKFLVKDFGLVIKKDFEKYFPDGDGLLHYPDGHQNERIVTMPIMGRKYYERTNYVYNPNYTSLYSDNEMTEVAKKLNKYKFVNTHLFIHNHYKKNKKLLDAQYLKTDNPIVKAADKKIFLERQKNNFEL